MMQTKPHFRDKSLPAINLLKAFIDHGKSIHRNLYLVVRLLRLVHQLIKFAANMKSKEGA